MTRILGWLWPVALGLVLLFLWGVSDSLPERLAVHFDAAGSPNGFQQKGAFLASFLTLVCGMNAVFGALFLGLGRIPLSAMKLPGKDRWNSSPELRTLLYARLKAVLALLGLFLNTTFLITVQVVHQANVPGAAFHIPRWGGLSLILAGPVFLIAFLWVILRPPAEKPGE